MSPKKAERLKTLLPLKRIDFSKEGGTPGSDRGCTGGEDDNQGGIYNKILKSEAICVLWTTYFLKHWLAMAEKLWQLFQSLVYGLHKLAHS